MNLKLIDAAIDGYQGHIDEGDAARLAFFRTLWGALDACVREAQSSDDASLALSSYAAPDAGTVKHAGTRGRPVLQEAPITANEALLAACAERLAAVAVESDIFLPDASNAVGQISWASVIHASDMKRAGSDPSSWLESLVDRLVDEGLAENHARLAALLASLALKAQLEKPSQLIMKAHPGGQPGESHSLLCPVCGSAPMMGHVGQHTASVRGRRLVCSQCGAAWDFDRVRCARCGTRNQAHLHFYHIGDDEAHRLEICDECDGYLRVLYSEDALAACSYEVEDVVMARLDALARDPRITGKKA